MTPEAMMSAGSDEEERQRRGQKESVVVGREPGDAEAAPREYGEESRHADEADGAEFLADGREDEVGVAGRQIARVTEAEATCRTCRRWPWPRWHG